MQKTERSFSREGGAVESSKRSRLHASAPVAAELWTLGFICSSGLLEVLNFCCFSFSREQANECPVQQREREPAAAARIPAGPGFLPEVKREKELQRVGIGSMQTLKQMTLA